MELWMVITVGAAFLQNLRSVFQKQLSAVMSVTSATFVRFGFGVPFAALYWSVLMGWGGYPMPGLSLGFFFWMVIGALSQIGATFLLVHLFSLRNFAVGGAYSRTEPMQTAIFASIFFNVQFSAGVIIGIAIAVLGVMLISAAQTRITPRSLVTSMFTRTALIGLGAGTLFGLAAVGYQAATRSVVADVFYVQSATTLLIGITFQTLVMLAYLAWREPGEFALIRRAAKPALAVGFVGATATFGWFTAFALQQAAIVKVVAQVEMLFAFASSVLVFKERINRVEFVGCVLIVVSIICMVLFA